MTYEMMKSIWSGDVEEDQKKKSWRSRFQGQGRVAASSGGWVASDASRFHLHDGLLRSLPETGPSIREPIETAGAGLVQSQVLLQLAY
jgi:hypothetical protein